jgi:hypothetical protein
MVTKRAVRQIAAPTTLTIPTLTHRLPKRMVTTVGEDTAEAEDSPTRAREAAEAGDFPTRAQRRVGEEADLHCQLLAVEVEEGAAAPHRHLVIRTLVE